MCAERLRRRYIRIRHIMGDEQNVTASMVQSEMAHLQAEVEQLREENRALKEERDALLNENRDLRREATLVRLYQSMGARKAARHLGGDTTTIPAPAAELYNGLPVSFKFADYFRHAASANLDTKTARECLLYYLNEHLLVQVGPRLRKTDIVHRHVS